MNITRPTGMTAIDWADCVVLELDAYAALGRLDNEAEWQDWAVQFRNITALGKGIPDPYGFENWNEWADRFVGALL